MSFKFSQHGEFEYNEDEECIAQISVMSPSSFQIHYRAHCSECDDEIDIMDSPKRCPSCNRHIIDWRET